MITEELKDIPLDKWPTDENEYDLTIPFEISQIKEKFGSLRIYYHITIDGTGITEAMANRIAGAIHLTEELSTTVCEVCGDIGHPCSNKGWLKTLCPDCAQTMGYAPLEDMASQQGET